MERLLPETGPDPKALSPLDLAFVGDAVYDLLAREYLAAGGSCPVKKLHQRKAAWVNCGAQAQALRTLWPELDPEEQAIALRGRNAHVGHLPKNAAPADYHGATALEALFGWLYLMGRGQRLRQLFLAAIQKEEGGAAHE